MNEANKPSNVMSDQPATRDVGELLNQSERLLILWLKAVDVVDMLDDLRRQVADDVPRGTSQVAMINAIQASESSIRSFMEHVRIDRQPIVDRIIKGARKR